MESLTNSPEKDTFFIDVYVLRGGGYGSSTSSSILQRVSMKFTTMSVEKWNRFRETLRRGGR